MTPDLVARADAILRASRERNGSGEAYRADFERVVKTLAQLHANEGSMTEPSDVSPQRVRMFAVREARKQGAVSVADLVASATEIASFVLGGLGVQALSGELESIGDPLSGSTGLKGAVRAELPLAAGQVGDDRQQNSLSGIARDGGHEKRSHNESFIGCATTPMMAEGRGGGNVTPSKGG